MAGDRRTVSMVLELVNKASTPLKKLTQDTTKSSKQLRETRDKLKLLQSQQADISGYRKAQIALKKQQRAITKYNQVIETNSHKQAQQEQSHAELTAKLKSTKIQYNKLAKSLADGTGKGEAFHAELQRTKHALEQQQTAVDSSSEKLKNYKSSTTRAKNQIKKLSEQQIKANHNIDVYGKKLDEAGIDVTQLSRTNRELQHSVADLNAEYEKQKQNLEQVAKRQKKLAKIRSIGSKAGAQASSLAGQATAVGLTGGYFFKTQLLDTAAQFEDYQAALKTVEGSNEKARKAMNWVSNFAASTPYQLEQVTEAYVQLRNYGLNPTNGLLKTLGDTSASMNKPIMQSVEAIADAITGENERLKEFGIRASKANGLITYEYTDKSGNQQSLSASSEDRNAIQQTLETIWNQKYAGAMDERSKTWNGMMSNMGDQWTRFKQMMMSAGLFDWMKGKLGGLLKQLNTMAANGQLQALAKEWGTKLKNAAIGLYEITKAIANAASKVASLVGGWENLIYIMAGLKVLPLVISIGQLSQVIYSFLPIAGKVAPIIKSAGTAMLAFSSTAIPAVLGGLKALSMFMLTNPIGIAITAIGTAALLIYKFWEPISNFFSNIWQQVKQAFRGGIGGVTALLVNWSPFGLLYKAIQMGLSALGIDLPEKFSEFGANLVSGLISGFLGKLNALKEGFKGVSDWIKGKLGIGSSEDSLPTKTQTVIKKLTPITKDNELEQAPSPPEKLRKKLKQASVGVVAASTIALPVAANQPDLAPPIRQLDNTVFDTRPPLQARRQVSQDNSIHVGEIHVHPAPGMDEQALARLVATEIQKLQTTQAAAHRSRLQDED